jgi:beta-mannosidase
MLLNGTWRLAGFADGEGLASGAHRPDHPDGEWIPVSVPGDVHSALLAAGRIPDPYAERNIEACEWVERREWWYRTEFDAPTLPDRGQATLVFDGLDTFATVYVNGTDVGRTGNALVPHRLDVTSALVPGRNVLAVRFRPTVPTVEKRDCSQLWVCFWPQRVWVRKAAMNFGWDWGPRLVTCGIWREVHLEIGTEARIESWYARTHCITPEHAVVLAGIGIERLPGVPPMPLSMRAALTHGVRTITAQSHASGRSSEARILVPNPELWRPAGDSPQPLHHLTLELIGPEGRVLDTASGRIGIRTVSLLQEPDPDGMGKTFTFVVNGRRVFAKGADWIPVDNLIGAAPKERYRELVRMAAEANMNMLRVWGGGVYEDDEFYDACDELGIMVWQDFMFSCAAYPAYFPEFIAGVEVEAQKAVKRLRNHPSIVLWCGNNENDWIDCGVNADSPRKPFFGRRIYHRTLPSVCAELDPSRPYWPSSPYGGSDHNSEREGDRHNWQVWAGQVYPQRFGEPSRADVTPEGVSFRRYAEDTGRFISEYGIHASPVLATLRKRVSDLAYDSEDFLYRIKDPDVTRKARMMEAHTGLPTTLEQYEVFSMLVQAEGLRFAIEHYRRRMFDCSGSLFWQLNDCWPGISWSVIDYDLNPKAGWYYAKRAYAPLALSLEYSRDGAALWVVSDLSEEVPLRVVLTTADTLGGRVLDRAVSGVAKPNAATELCAFPFEELQIDDPSHYCVVIREARGRMPEHATFFAEMKDTQFRPAVVTAEVSPTEAGARIALVSDALAHFVGVDVDGPRALLSDNYVTLLPGEERVVEAFADGPIEQSMVHVKCLNDHMAT